jgi:hypothetical protein
MTAVMRRRMTGRKSSWDCEDFGKTPSQPAARRLFCGATLALMWLKCLFVEDGIMTELRGLPSFNSSGNYRANVVWPTTNRHDTDRARLKTFFLTEFAGQIGL